MLLCNATNESKVVALPVKPAISVFSEGFGKCGISRLCRDLRDKSGGISVWNIFFRWDSQIETLYLVIFLFGKSKSL